MVEAYRKYLLDLYPKDDIGPELFVRIVSDPFVRQYGKCTRLDAGHRSWIRQYVKNDHPEIPYEDVKAGRATRAEMIASLHLKICPSFWREDGLAQETVESLLHSAKVSTVPAGKRVVAIRTLLRFFERHLSDDARSNPMTYVGYEVPQKSGEVGRFVNAKFDWKEEASRIQAEGVVLNGVRFLLQC